MRTLQSPAVAFALTRGLSLRQALWHHGVRNALVPIVTYLGLQLVILIEGVVVVESLFAWPGIGHALVHAVVARDIPMLQGTALAMGLLFVGLNTAVDGLCLLLDPRARAA
ncbi:ABC transporter permease subunit [Elstera litoralis]|uniref:ABC transporter permease subunit n=1 Tax=Elstera litoralis TaxID=552518 RepID=UPI0022B71838|nr:ABC transporter permease [Elstera litoralis]